MRGNGFESLRAWGLPLESTKKKKKYHYKEKEIRVTTTKQIRATSPPNAFLSKDQRAAEGGLRGTWLTTPRAFPDPKQKPKPRSGRHTRGPRGPRCQHRTGQRECWARASVRTPEKESSLATHEATHRGHPVYAERTVSGTCACYVPSVPPRDTEVTGGAPVGCRGALPCLQLGPTASLPQCGPWAGVSVTSWLHPGPRPRPTRAEMLGGPAPLLGLTFQ